MELSEVRNMLRINRHRLDDELEVHAEVLDRVGQEVVRRNSRMIELKKKLEEVEARVTSDLKDADPKLTNPMAEREAKRNRDYTAAWEAYQRARHEHEEWESVQKAWYQRGFDLKALGELFGNQYFALDSIRGPYPSNTESLRSGMRLSHDAVTTRRISSSEEATSNRPRRRTLVDS